jgi:hypothetical protein
VVEEPRLQGSAKMQPAANLAGQGVATVDDLAVGCVIAAPKRKRQLSMICHLFSEGYLKHLRIVNLGLGALQ